MVSQASTWVLHGFVLNFLWTSAKTINWWPVKNIFPTALIKSATLGSISFSRQPSFSSRITPATPARKIKQLPYGLIWQIRRTTCTTMSTIVIGLKYDTYILEPIFVALNEDFQRLHPFPGESAACSQIYQRRRSWRLYILQPFLVSVYIWQVIGAIYATLVQHFKIKRRNKDTCRTEIQNFTVQCILLFRDFI